MRVWDCGSYRMHVDGRGGAAGIDGVAVEYGDGDPDGELKWNVHCEDSSESGGNGRDQTGPFEWKLQI